MANALGTGNVKILPFMIARYAGLPFQYLFIPPKDISLSDGINAYHEAKKSVNEKREVVLDQLFAFIETCTDPKTQNRLQNIRRNIFNDRPLRAKELKQINEACRNDVIDSVEEYQIALEKTATVKTSIESIYSELTWFYRTRLKQLITSDKFGKALLLSSADLFDKIDRLKDTYERKAMNKKARAVELGMWKYASRMVSKTSPFSTFTDLGLATLVPKLSTPPRIDPARTYETAALNTHVLSIINELVSKDERMRSLRPLRLNPTLSIDASGTVRYLSNIKNIESFQQIKSNPLLVFLAQELRKGKKDDAAIDYERITDTLARKTNAPREKAAAFVDRLLDVDLLQYGLLVSPYAKNWIAALQEKLVRYKDRLTNINPDLIDQVLLLCDRLAAYSQQSLQQRKNTIDEVFTAAMALREKYTTDAPDKQVPFTLDQEFSKTTIDRAFTLRREQMIYEDSYQQAEVSVSGQRVGNFVHKIHQLLVPFQERITTSDYKQFLGFFNRHYRNNGVNKVPVLRFYEEFYRVYRSKNLASPKSISTDEVLMADLGIDFFRQQFRRSLASKMDPSDLSGSKSIDIAYSDIIPAEADTKTVSAKSYGMVFQKSFRENPDEDYIVINALGPGYGKMFSRFLYELDQKLYVSIRELNEELLRQEGVIGVENIDASYFNANIHPPLMEYEIRNHVSEVSMGCSKEIEINDIGIRHLASQDKIELFQISTDLPVKVFDLGFESAQTRSKLFRILQSFNTASYSPQTLVQEELIRAFLFREGKIHLSGATVIIPRAVYDGDIVLQRKTWYAKRDEIPRMKDYDTITDYVLALRDYRDRNYLPQLVYVSSEPRELSNMQPGVESNLFRGNYKPQIVDFNNPISLKLFDKNLIKADPIIRFEEMLPAPTDLMAAKEGSLVSEYIVQWYA